MTENSELIDEHRRALDMAIAESRNRDDVFHAAAVLANSTIGHQLFTIMRFDPERMRVQRVYSDDPESYPPGGAKDKKDSPWGQHVLEKGTPYIGRNADDIRASFDDHVLILGLGLESVLNLPIRLGGRTVGTMNMLHRAGWFDDSHIEIGQRITARLAAALVAWPHND